MYLLILAWLEQHINRFLIQKHLLGSLCVLLLAVTGCGSSQNADVGGDGIWSVEGYGTLLEIDEQTVTFYEPTEVSCLEADETRLEQRAGQDYLSSYALVTSGDELTLRSDLGYTLTASRRAKLPQACVQAETNPDSPTRNFDIFWHTFNYHYAFFDLYDVDWQVQYNTYRPQITQNMSEDELLTVVSSMIEPLKDGHVFIITGEQNGELTGYSPGRSPAWAEAEDDLANVIINNYLTGDIIPFAQGGLIYSQLGEDIAYLNITRMEDFSEDDTDQEALADVLPRINTLLKNPSLEALVIDIRFNGGGTDENSAHIASYFTDAARTVYTKSAWYQTEFSAEQDIVLQPADNVVFDKPIVLLTSGMTASAAEIFTLMMRELPNVTLIGEPTSGAFSDIFSRTLPNGWEFGLSNERYTATDGSVYEKVGIPPQQEVLITLEDVRAGRDAVLEAALEHLQYDVLTNVRP